MSLDRHEARATRAAIVSVISAVVGAEVDITATLDEIGVDSISLAEIVARLDERLGVRLTLDVVLRCRTVGDIIAALRAAGPGQKDLLGCRPGLTTNRVPATWNQRLRLAQNQRGNIAIAAVVPEVVDLSLIKRAWERVSVQFDILRAHLTDDHSFVINDAPIAPVVSLGTVPPTSIKNSLTELAVPNCDLVGSPLCQLVVAVSNGKTWIMPVAERLVCDALSLLNIAIPLLDQLKNDQSNGVAPNRMTFAEFAQREHDYTGTAEASRILEHYASELPGDAPFVAGPASSYFMPDTYSGRAGESVYIPPAEVERLRTRSRQYQGTVYVELAARFAAALTQTGIIDHSTAARVSLLTLANRTWPRCTAAVGPFANTMPIPIPLESDLSLAGPAMVESFSRARAHEKMPFGYLCSELYPHSFAENPHKFAAPITFNSNVFRSAFAKLSGIGIRRISTSAYGPEDRSLAFMAIPELDRGGLVVNIGYARGKDDSHVQALIDEFRRLSYEPRALTPRCTSPRGY